MAKYRLPLVRDLARQLALTPRAQRERQMNRLEHLIRDVQPRREYPANFVVYRLTLYNPAPNNDTCKGEDLKADLITLLDEISGTLDLRVGKRQTEELLTLDQIKDLYDISDKELAEWRRTGLITRRYLFPDGAQRSAARRVHAEAFVASLGQGPMYQIRVPNDKQRELILQEAHRLADAGEVSLPEAVRTLAAKLAFPPRLIRHAIRSHEMANPDDLLFPPSGVPLEQTRRRQILDAHQAGKRAAEIARQVGLGRKLVADYLKTLRAEELLRTDIEYRYDPLFDAPDADERILHDPALDEPRYKPKETPDRVPPYFADLSHRPPLKKAEETALFRKYNYIKYRFARLRESLRPSEGDDPDLLARLEELAAEASRCRVRLVEANLRLVVKLARQHSGPIAPINDLISEGNLSLLRAVEKFDFTRGTRFSTYATWCIVKRFARVVPEENYRIQTFVTGADEVLEVQPDPSVSELERKENLAHIRAELDKVMTHLTGREREILLRRFGLTGSPETLEQIGQRLGVTRERVRQLETRALRKAADQMRLRGI
jgi:RNA polymerase sigma factor (sigma-70 family)